MTGFTFNYHVHDDDEIDVQHTTYGADRTRVPYVALTVGDVNLFLHDPADLLALAAEAAGGAAELMAAQRAVREAAALEAAYGEDVTS